MPESVTSASAQVIAPRVESDSLTELYGDQDFALAWDNSVGHQISRHLLYLRRYRELSQAAVGRLIGSSQSHIARIEAGHENMTADTAERLINALGGRLIVAIPPKEFPAQRLTPWWKTVNVYGVAGWKPKFVVKWPTPDGTERALVGMERIGVADALTMVTSSTSVGYV